MSVIDPNGDCANGTKTSSRPGFSSAVWRKSFTTPTIVSAAVLLIGDVDGGADRVAGDEVASERLGDHGDREAARAVARVERAAFTELHPQRLEVSVRCDREPRVPSFSSVTNGQLPVTAPSISMLPDPRKGMAVTTPAAATPETSNSLQRIAGELHLLIWLRKRRPDMGLEHGHVGWRETRIDLCHAQKAVREQPGANEQQYRQRDLGSNERFADPRASCTTAARRA